MTEPNVACPACGGRLRPAGEDGRFVCRSCGSSHGQRAGGPADEFAAGYDLHDVAERWLIGQLERRGHAVERTGFDPSTEDGERVVGHRPSDETAPPDLRANGVPVEVKATRYPKYHGNVRLYKFEGYPGDWWIACFVVDAGEVTETGAYRVGEVEPEGVHDGPYAEEFVEVAREDIRPLDDLLAAVADAETDPARYW